MREIKFRAWDWVEKQMCTVIVADFQDTQAKLFFRFPKSGTQGIISADLMQYIGAKDKNGVEIYEGDVIRENAGGKYRDYVVRWSDGKCGFIADTKALCKVFPCLNQGTAKYLEVVGNIYESPELVRNETDT